MRHYPSADQIPELLQVLCECGFVEEKEGTFVNTPQALVFLTASSPYSQVEYLKKLEIRKHELSGAGSRYYPDWSGNTTIRTHFFPVWFSRQWRQMRLSPRRRQLSLEQRVGVWRQRDARTGRGHAGNLLATEPAVAARRHRPVFRQLSACLLRLRGRRASHRRSGRDLRQVLMHSFVEKRKTKVRNV